MNWDTSSTESFWYSVYFYKDPSGAQPFKEFSRCVLKLLCLPISNAEIERVFSQVTEVKSKKRASMKTELLEAILYCKFGLSRRGQDVTDFVPPQCLLKFDSSIYD